MARNTQVVELDLRSGVLSNESGYAIGPRLRRSQNAIWQPYTSLEENRRRILSMPPAPAQVQLYILNDASDVLALTAAPDLLPFRAIASAKTSADVFLVYSADNGTLLSNTGETIFGRATSSGSIAYWPDIEKPTVYASHPGLNNIYQVREFGVSVYTPDVTPGEAFAGAAALNVHLDRLWIGHERRAWYTDPFDPKQIRATSFIPFEDFISSFFRASSSPVDAGAGLHLCVGLFNSVWVIDGDPTFGNAVKRRLVAGNGIADQSCVCETAYGAVCLLTDGQLYLIPAGAQEIFPIGSPIRDQTRNFHIGDFAASLQWHAPYVYISYADLNVTWILDFTAGPQQPPKFWGPVSSLDNPNAFPGRLLPSTGLFGEQMTASQGNSVFPIQQDVDTVLRITSLATGYIQVEGHKVEPRRVVLETTRRPTPQVITCRVHQADGTVAGFKRTIPQTSAPGPDTLCKVVWDFSINPVVSEFVWFEFIWEVGVQPDVHRAYAEIRTQPLQDTVSSRG